MLRPISIAALLGAAALAGCGSDDAGPGTSTPATPSGGVTADAIEIKEFKFNPGDAVVKVGQKIVWTNEDTAPHDVVADDGSFKSETLEKDDEFAYTADKAGSFPYICSIHPTMKGTLTVEG